MTAPIRHIALPSLPSVPSSSLRKYEPRTAPMSTLRAPRGVTRIAGAKAYAAKLQTSPRPTNLMLVKMSIGIMSDRALTSRNTGPPQGISKVDKAVAFKAMSLFCLNQSLGSGLVYAQGGMQNMAPAAEATMEYAVRPQADSSYIGRTFFVITKLVPGIWLAL